MYKHDLTMDALLENGLSHIRCYYHSNIIPNENKAIVLAL